MKGPAGFLVLCGESEELVAERIAAAQRHHCPANSPVMRRKLTGTVEIASGTFLVALTS